MRSDEYFMRKCLELAKKARPAPNPRVGCVIVRAGRIIGKGYHRKAGMPHAEIEAISRAKNLKGATMYVNLEPCTHHGITKPCVDEIIREGIKSVFIATKDQNPLVNGKGIAKLRRNRIKVKIGVLEKEAKQLNEDFFTFIIKKRPFVVLKVAMSRNGRITGRRFISSLESRRKAHELRADSDAIVVGINTILKDDPRLTTRLVKGRNPVRVVLDSKLRIPLNSKVLGKEASTIIATTTPTDRIKRLKRLESKGVEVLACKEKDNKVDLKDLLRKLGERGIIKLMVEGGSKVITAFVNQGLVDKAHLFISPDTLKGKRFLESGCLRLKNLSISRIGKDIHIAGYVND